MIVSAYFTVNGEPEEGLGPIIQITEVSEDNGSIQSNTVIDFSDEEEMVDIGGGFYAFNFSEAKGYTLGNDYLILMDGGDVQNLDNRFIPTSARDNVDLESDVISNITTNVWSEDITAYDTSEAGGVLSDTQNSTIDTIDLIEELLKYDKNRTRINRSNRTLTVYDNDGTTPLRIFDLKDQNGNASISEVYERDPR